MLLLIAFFVSVGVLLLVYVLYSYYGPNDRINKRLHTYFGAERNEQQHAETAWREIIADMGSYFKGSSLAPSLEIKLLKAGILLRGSELMVVMLGIAVTMAVLSYLVSGKLALAILMFPVTFFGTLIFLQIKIDKRLKKFDSQLGDALVLIANSMRVGHSFWQALDMIANEMPAPISTEFGRVLREIGVGVTTEDSLRNLLKRIDSSDLDLVITAVLIQRQLGGNLAEVLDKIAETIRSRAEIRGEVKTLTAQGKISGIIVGILPFAIAGFLFVINPGYMMILFDHPMGKMMLAIAIFGQVLAMIIVQKIVNIKV